MDRDGFGNLHWSYPAPVAAGGISDDLALAVFLRALYIISYGLGYIEVTELKNCYTKHDLGADDMTNIKIDLKKNIQLCFNSGFGILITANNDENYRNAIISIHNGLELLMKYYLEQKEKLLIFKNINYHLLIYERNDLIQDVNLKKVKVNTISFNECIDILTYFSKLPNNYTKYLTQLNNQRNDCVHYQFSYNEIKLRKLLIFNIYQFICDLIIEMKLEPKDFILEEYIPTLDEYKDTIDDEINHSYIEKIEAAKKHYFRELTVIERKQKADTEDYTKRKYDITVECPACKNNALLSKKIQSTTELLENHVVTKRNLILNDLSCHYCGLNITDYDQLKLKFENEERSLRDMISFYDCPQEDCDCPPEDCPPEDCDCPPEDCPPEDCPDK